MNDPARMNASVHTGAAKRTLLLSLLLFAFLSPMQGCSLSGPPVSALHPPQPPPNPVALQIREQLEATVAPHAMQSAQLRAFYETRDYQPAWVDSAGLNVQGRELLRALRNAPEEGLRPEAYHLREIDELLSLATKAAPYRGLLSDGWSSHLELRLSDAFLRFGRHMTRGRLSDPRDPAPKALSGRNLDLMEVMRAALENNRVAEALRELAPPHEGYRRLREALARLRNQPGDGDWRPISADGRLIRLWSRDARVPQLRRRLELLGDMPPLKLSDPQLLDRSTGEALKRFQARHGLKPDGVAGPQTLDALNLTIAERIERIELNMERWRSLPDTLGERHLRVNIPDFRLQVFEKSQCTLEMPVVVGRSDRPTPAFSALMTFLEFSPYWYVPRTILAEDELPRIKRDPGYLALRDFEIVSWDKANPIPPERIDWKRVTAESFPGMLRQKPGPRNPLGRVKFIFPNAHSVYIHDTPKQNLFERDERSLSSGCIRVSRPEELATHLLLLEDGWDADSIRSAMNRTSPQRVDLAYPVPVHLTYFTAWVDEQGQLQLRFDLYGEDAGLKAALVQQERRLAGLPFAGLSPEASDLALSTPPVTR